MVDVQKIKHPTFTKTGGMAFSQGAAARTSRKARVDLAISILTSTDLGLGAVPKKSGNSLRNPWFRGGHLPRVHVYVKCNE